MFSPLQRLAALPNIIAVIIRLAFYSFFSLIRLARRYSDGFPSYGATRLMARVVLLFYFVAFHCGQDSVLAHLLFPLTTCSGMELRVSFLNLSTNSIFDANLTRDLPPDITLTLLNGCKHVDKTLLARCFPLFLFAAALSLARIVSRQPARTTLRFAPSPPLCFGPAGVRSGTQPTVIVAKGK